MVRQIVVVDFCLSFYFWRSGYLGAERERGWERTEREARLIILRPMILPTAKLLTSIHCIEEGIDVIIINCCIPSGNVLSVFNQSEELLGLPGNSGLSNWDWPVGQTNAAVDIIHLIQGLQGTLKVTWVYNEKCWVGSAIEGLMWKKG